VKRQQPDALVSFGAEKKDKEKKSEGESESESNPSQSESESGSEESSSEEEVVKKHVPKSKGSSKAKEKKTEPSKPVQNLLDLDFDPVPASGAVSFAGGDLLTPSTGPARTPSSTQPSYNVGAL